MQKHSHKHFDNLRVEKNADGEAVITGEITLEALEHARGEALKHLNSNVEIPGFRRGNTPETVLIKNIGEMKVLEEMAEISLAHQYGNIIKETGLKPIGRPQVAITKLAPGIPLEFKITVTLEPEFALPDYKKIAKNAGAEIKDDANVTDEEVDAVIKEIEKRGWKPQLKEGEDLKTKARENLLEEKKFRNKEKKRLAIIESLIKSTEIKIPKLLVESELDKMLAQFKDDVEKHMKPASTRGESTRGGWDEYLKSIKKTVEDIRSEWKEKAESRAKAELIMLKIAETEKLEPTPEELDHETSHLLTHYKDADPMRLRIYVYQQLQNQKVFEFLETL